MGWSAAPRSRVGAGPRGPSPESLICVSSPDRLAGRLLFFELLLEQRTREREAEGHRVPRGSQLERDARALHALGQVRPVVIVFEAISHPHAQPLDEPAPDLELGAMD